MAEKSAAKPSNLHPSGPQATSSTGSWWAVAAFAGLALVASTRPARGDLRVERLPNSGNGGDRDAGSSQDQPRSNANHHLVNDGRGRDAKSPSDLPLRGWTDVLWRTYEDLSSHRILAVSAGVTFYALLALFPAIAAFVSLYGLFANASTINDQLNSLQGMMPGGAVDIIGEQVKRIASKPGGTLGLALVSGLAISLWSANAGMKALFDALNVVNDETEKRSFVVLNALSLTFTLGAIAFLLLAIAAVVVLPILFNLVGLGGALVTILAIGRWPVMLLIVAGALALLYRYGPSRATAQWRWVSWGSAISAVAWLGGSALFSWYVSSFGSYNETYGSLGGAIGFMTWIWISTTIVLLGAEINAEMEHQTAVDTTGHGGKPLGSRRATMADTLGEAKG
ncbi:YihY/virulence factor BrkB family protein [Lichenihabitans sp. PAMC28606]|uniref:YihY/virulence factor BrkB family protein n=1 Tax=Lichenihabitans sp. PAMC28606 TaxID=2880932 RepID=UPI001D0B4CDA|nr:YihY/virulence factor BrkB family protein [Lichenihabitans sp. PAMC28606]UDL93218.1 YihY/virulence factor BrkB family protein [Lichenihabitans sp. PAMC28606]